MIFSITPLAEPIHEAAIDDAAPFRRQSTLVTCPDKDSANLSRTPDTGREKNLQIDLNLFGISAIIRAWNQTDRFKREPETC